MTTLITLRFAFPNDAAAIFALTAGNPKEFLELSKEAIERACADHAGIVAISESGQLVGACLFRRDVLDNPQGVRSACRVPVTYLHNLVVDDQFRGRQLGKRLVEAAAALSHAVASENEPVFPEFVAVAFSDAPYSTKTMLSLGAIDGPQNTFVSAIHPAFCAIDHRAWKNRERVGTAREHTNFLIPRERILEVCDWLSEACFDGYLDQGRGVVFKFFDHSEGRSGICREICLLSQRDTAALARLGVDVAIEKSA